MGSPTCPYCGCLAVTRAVEADGNAPSRSAAYRCERRLKLHERRPTPPAPADDAVPWDATRAAWVESRGCPQWGWDDFREAIRRRLPLPAPDDAVEEAASVAAMREAFTAWQVGLYPKGDDRERARVDWVSQIRGALPEPFAVLCDGESVYLGDEWGAWQSALRSLPLPPASAGGEVEAALAGEAFGIVQHVVNHARCGINLDGTRRTYGSDEECGRNWIALVDKCEALLAALAAERAAAKGGNGA